MILRRSFFLHFIPKEAPSVYNHLINQIKSDELEQKKKETIVLISLVTIKEYYSSRPPCRC